MLRLALSVALAAFAAPALAQQFELMPETPPQAAALTAPPHLDRGAYLAARGQQEGDAVRLIWRIERESLDGEPAGEARERIVTVGPGFVLDSGGDDIRLYDFTQNRRLTLYPAANTFRNDSFYGDIRRRLDTYLSLSQGGTLDDIPLPGGRHFDRFWLESAMGLRREEAGLVSEQENGVLRIQRDSLVVFEATLPIGPEVDSAAEVNGEEAEPAADAGALPLRGDDAPDGDTVVTLDASLYGATDADLFRRWMRHALPIHPDAFAALDGPAIPSRFDFAVVSPDSPDGRREIWTLIAVETADADFPLPEGFEPVIQGPDMLVDRVAPTVRSALAEPDNAPGEPEFLAEIRRLRDAGDLAGAYLAAFQETAHNGPCRRGDANRRACAESQRVTAAGLGDPDFEAMFEAIGAVGTGDHARAIRGLLPYLDHGGLAGAAANTIVANELLASAAETAETFADLDPRELLAAAQAADPYAPSIYWHLGRVWLASNNAPAAWVAFDLGRSLPNATGNAVIAQAGAQEGRLAILAPAFFAPASPR